MSKSSQLPEYKKPPVVEVVCGVLFKSLDRLVAPHLGVLWEKYRKDYPVLQEQPPLAPVIERFDNSQPVAYEFSEIPPLPRTWFVHKEENGIIQVQRDRFLHNWKKVRPTDEYPRYTNVIKMFKKHLNSFKSFLDTADLEKFEPLQYEMTYVNHILLDNELDVLEEIADIFPDFCWRNQQGRFFSRPDSIHWRTSFNMPNNMGRLHISMRSAVRREDDMPIIMFELTARGIDADKSENSMWNWFDVAHEWIVNGFTDLTGHIMHKNAWQRTV